MKFRFDASGRGSPFGNAVRKPVAVGCVTVMLNTNPAVGGTDATFPMTTPPTWMVSSDRTGPTLRVSATRTGPNGTNICVAPVAAVPK